MQRDGMTYANVEDIKNALDVLETARAETQIYRALHSASDSVEGLCHRRFYPEIATRFFDWPNRQYARPWRLWLDTNTLISVTTLSSGGTTIDAADFFLRRSDQRDEPPFTHIEIDLDSNAAFGGGDTHQRDISITGLFGYWDEDESAGALAEELDASETGVDVTDGSLVGVGDLIRVGDERMAVTGRAFLDSGEDLTAAVSSASSTTIPVDDGSTFHEGETILIGGERMLIVDIAANDLVVKRAWDGTTLESHLDNANVFVSRLLTVVRGALGTTAAAHSTAAPVTRHHVPPLVRDLTIAEAMSRLVQERTAYARTIGVGEGEREVRGVGLADLREQARTEYGRKVRKRAI